MQLCAAVTDLQSVMLYLPATPWVLAKCVSSTLQCRVDAYVDPGVGVGVAGGVGVGVTGGVGGGVGGGVASWKKHVCVWSPQQGGIAMNR
jgi:hypothetical protein